MSWAALAAKSRDKPASTAPAAQHVTAPMAPAPAAGAAGSPRRGSPQRGGYSSPTAGAAPAPAAGSPAGGAAPAAGAPRRLVLDTGALIRGSAGLASRADLFVTVKEVLQEARDKRTRDWMDALPFEIAVSEPSKESMAEVVRVARRTGDYGTLSAVDLRVMALAHTVAQAHGAVREIAQVSGRPELAAGRPQGAGSATSAAGQPQMPGWGSWDDGDGAAPEEEDGAAAEEAEEAEEAEGDEAAGEEEAAGDEEAGETPAAADDQGWITPENIAEVRGEGNVRFGEAAAEEDDRRVGCMTTDFPMQNVLMHLGVLVVSVDGYQIRHLKRWVLRCHGCACIVRDTTRQFCPDCGSGDTLKRVSYTVNDQGEEQIWINPKKTINVRGTRYNLPKPRGGRAGTNKTVVLREDQLRRCGRSYNQDEGRTDKIASMLSDDWMWAGDTRGHAQTTHHRPTQSMYSRTKGRNPNHGRKRKI